MTGETDVFRGLSGALAPKPTIEAKAQLQQMQSQCSLKGPRDLLCDTQDMGAKIKQLFGEGPENENETKEMQKIVQIIAQGKHGGWSNPEAETRYFFSDHADPRLVIHVKGRGSFAVQDYNEGHQFSGKTTTKWLNEKLSQSFSAGQIDANSYGNPENIFAYNMMHEIGKSNVLGKLSAGFDLGAMYKQLSGEGTMTWGDAKKALAEQYGVNIAIPAGKSAGDIVVPGKNESALIPVAALRADWIKPIGKNGELQAGLSFTPGVKTEDMDLPEITGVWMRFEYNF